jgi:hypothetical protein
MKYDTDTYTQVCAWIGTACQLADEPLPVTDFEEFMSDKFGYRVKYINEYNTHDSANPKRVDLLFALHKDDVDKMVGDRLTKFGGEIKWYEDYVVNSRDIIPTSEILPDVKW